MKPDTQAADVVTAEQVDRQLSENILTMQNIADALNERDNLAAEVARLRERSAMTVNLSRECDALRGEVAEQRAELSRLRGELAELSGKVYIAGLWRCAKCDLVLQTTILNVASGNAFANTSPQTCPNCDVPMWRVAHAEQRKELFDANESLHDQLRRARDEAEVNANRLDFIDANCLEIGCSISDEEEGTMEWIVYKITGYPNDREWNPIGKGETLRAAIDAALKDHDRPASHQRTHVGIAEGHG